MAKAPPGTGRGMTTRLKTAEGRSTASQRWLTRQLNDPYVKAAKARGFRSRAAFKLTEMDAKLHLLKPGMRVVDLGAAPGSWSYVALARGARVLAVDRAPLRADLMRHPRLTFRRGDAFTFQPDEPVDWLLCDVIAAPVRSLGLLLAWVEARRARRFVVTIKFKGHGDYGLLEPLKRALPPLCEEFFLMRLCANKNEVCAFGTVRPA